MGSEALLSVGEVIAGKYKITRVIGVGGMGVVVEAEHLELGRSVALKFLRPDAATDTGAGERFLREARAAVRIRSEHVARVLDVGRDEAGSPFMVMEYLEGRDLGQVIAVDAPLPVPQAVGYLLQACEAIAEAHVLGIVHRDLKPSNIFVSAHADGTALVKVLDFGISKAAGRDKGFEAALTTTGVILGSPLYMSPEQLRSTRAVDARTDIWALGIVLFELLTARRAFDAETMPTLCAMIAADPPEPLRGGGRDFPVELEAVIARCLEKDPTDRFRTVADFAIALLPFAGPEGLASVERIVRVMNANETTAVSSSDALAAARSVTPTVRRRRRVTLGGLGALAVVVLVVFLFLRSLPHSQTVPTGMAQSTGAPPLPADRPVPSIDVAIATPKSLPSSVSSTTALDGARSARVEGPRPPAWSADVSKSKLKPGASATPALSASSHPRQGEVLDPLVDQR